MAKNPDQKDHHLPLYIVIMTAAMLFILWHRLREPIVYPLFFLDKSIYSVYGHLFGISQARFNNWTHVQYVLESKAWLQALQFSDFVAIQKDVGFLCRFFSAGLLVGMMVLVMMKAPEESMLRRFNFKGGKYGMKTTVYDKDVPEFISSLPVGGKKTSMSFIPTGVDFIDYQSQHWRTSVTSSYFDQYKNDPAWRPSDNELDVAVQIGIKTVSSVETPKLIEQYLLKQFTVPWEGLRKAPIQAQAIAALVVLNRKRQMNKRDTLAGNLAMCALPHREPELDVMADQIAPILTDAEVADLDRVASTHAFLETAMIAIYGYGGPFLDWGGRAGTLPPALFLWLKGVDRKLWYALQCVGRPSYFVEACGVVAHFKYERMLRKPVRVPYIKAAVGGLIATMKSMKIEDVEEYKASLMDHMS